MHSLNRARELPVEIIREIFTYVILQHDNKHEHQNRELTAVPPCRYISRNASLHPNHTQSRFFRYGEDGHCICWQIDMLNVAMVCWSWYFISVEIMQSRYTQALLGPDYHHHHFQSAPWLSLINYASYQRNYPFRHKLIQVLRDSQKADLAFNHQASHLVIDFASFDTIRAEPTRSNSTFIKRKVHHPQQLYQMTELIQLCTRVQQLDIVCDAEFSALIGEDNQRRSSSPVKLHTDQFHNEQNRILYASYRIQKAIISSGVVIKRLDLIGYNPIQRCPCCASKDWDQHLSPLIHALSLETVVLQHVLPSVELFEILANSQPKLRKLVLYKSMITRPKKITSAIDGSQGFLTSISQIPKRLWKQLTCIEIYEDIEDATSWRSQRCLRELAECVSPQLTEFVLQFETKEVNKRSLSDISNTEGPPLTIADVEDPNSPLNTIVSKCRLSLKKLKLVNVPKIPSP